MASSLSRRRVGSRDAAARADHLAIDRTVPRRTEERDVGAPCDRRDETGAFVVAQSVGAEVGACRRLSNRERMHSPSTLNQIPDRQAANGVALAGIARYFPGDGRLPRRVRGCTDLSIRRRWEHVTGGYLGEHYASNDPCRLVCVLCIYKVSDRSPAKSSKSVECMVK